MKRTINFVASGNRIQVTAELEPTNIASARTIDLEPTTGGLRFSMSAVCDGGAGQCVQAVRDAGEGVPEIEALCLLWERWHLNDMRSGTRAQRDFLDGMPQPGPRDFSAQKAALAMFGLEPDTQTRAGESYSYGSAWLFEPLPDDFCGALVKFLDSLDGRRFGDAPDVSDAPEIGGDIFDTRDVIKRLESYRDAVESLGFDPDNMAAILRDGSDELDALDADALEIVEEFVAVEEFAEALENYAADYLHGETVISDSYFVRYAEQLADDIGAMDSDARWPSKHIDWEAAAEELKQDYTALEYHGERFWVR